MSALEKGDPTKIGPLSQKEGRKQEENVFLRPSFTVRGFDKIPTDGPTA